MRTRPHSPPPSFFPGAQHNAWHILTINHKDLFSKFFHLSGSNCNTRKISCLKVNEFFPLCTIIVIINITHNGKKNELGLTFLSLCPSQRALKIH